MLDDNRNVTPWEAHPGYSCCMLVLVYHTLNSPALDPSWAQTCDHECIFQLQLPYSAHLWSLKNSFTANNTKYCQILKQQMLQRKEILHSIGNIRNEANFLFCCMASDSKHRLCDDNLFFFFMNGRKKKKKTSITFRECKSSGPGSSGWILSTYMSEMCNCPRPVEKTNYSRGRFRSWAS